MALRENILGVRKHDPQGLSAGDDSDDATLISPARINVGRRPSGFKRTITRVVLTPEQQLVRDEENRKKKRVFEETHKKIIIGLDFGTTYSGIAYSSSTKAARDVETITNWGGGGTNDILEKVPSVIAYADENDFDNDLWGYDVKPGMVSCRWFKLLLDEATAATDFDDPLLAKSIGEGLLRLPDGKSARDVAADYLRCLYHHILKSLNGMTGTAVVDNTPILFELTIPATWSRAARSSTRKAAVAAGFGSRARDTIVLVDEPEAAAIATIRLTVDSFGSEMLPFQKQTCVTVVDMGGGTTDCITYRIAGLEPLQLEEACIGEGGKIGGTTIDRNFFDFLKKRFESAFTNVSTRKTTVGSVMFQTFEELKRDFRGCHAEKKTYHVPLKMKVDPDDDKLKQWYDDEDDMVIFTSQDMESFFDPVIKIAFKLVKMQVNRTRAANMPPVQTIVLAGGLGSSPYVKYRLEQFVEEHMKGKVEVVTPRRPWSAVCRGACIRALEKPPVHLRKARDSIAMSAHVAWDEGEHDSDVDEKWTCPVSGEVRAGKQMIRIIVRGEKIRPTTKKRQKFYAPIEKIKKNRAILISQDIYRSVDEEPSPRLDDTWEFCGNITLDFTKTVNAENNKRRKTNSGEALTEADVPVEILMFPGSDKGMMEVQGQVGTAKVGNAKIEWFAAPDATKEL